MDKHPQFSVIIPSYCAASTLGEAIKSVLIQEDVSFEVIVVDDGSPQNDHLVAAKLALSHSNIHVIRTRNSGVSAARNAGARCARGQFLAFLDADDVMLAGALQAHADAYEREPQVNLTFGRVRFWAPPKSVHVGRLSAYHRTLPLPLILGDNQVCTASNIVVRSDTFRQVNGFNEGMRRAEDQDLLARVALCGFAIRGLDQTTVAYRCSQDGLSANGEAFDVAWRQMLAIIRFIAPEQVDHQLPEIEARFRRYQVRRRLRLGTSQCRDCFALTRALLRCPALMMTEPKRSLATVAGILAACSLPKTLTREILAR